MSARHRRRGLQTRDLHLVALILVRLIAAFSGRSRRVTLVTLVVHDDVRFALRLLSIKEAVNQLTSLRSHLLLDGRQELVASAGLECLSHAFLDLVGESAISNGRYKPIFSVVVASAGRETRHRRYSTSAGGSDGSPLETALDIRLDLRILLVEALLSLARSNTLTEVRHFVELADGVSVQVVDAGEGTMAQRLLVISKEETAELLSLEEISAMILILGHSKHVSSWR